LSKSPSVFFGIDVSKDSLSIALWSDSPSVEDIPNATRSIRSWLKRIPASSVIGMESTNTYHELVARLAHDAGHRVHVLQPRAVNSYAKSLRVRGKTDQMDAAVIARMVAKEGEELRIWIPPTPTQNRLRQLSRARGGLARMLGSLRQMSQSYTELGTVCKDLEKAFEQAIETLQQRVEEQVNQDAKMAEFNKRVQEIAGVGAVVGTTLSSLFHSYQLSSPDAAIAYVGFDPRPRESGKWEGERRISKHGPSEPRRCLFLAGRSAMNAKVWESYVATQKAKGLSATQIAIIVARKIIKIAWHMWKRPEMRFDPSRIQCAI
jgi:transposase